MVFPTGKASVKVLVPGEVEVILLWWEGASNLTAELIRSVHINSCLPITTEIGYNFSFALSRKVNYVKIFAKLKILTFPEIFGKRSAICKKTVTIYTDFEIFGDCCENSCFIFVSAKTFGKILIFTNVFAKTCVRHDQMRAVAWKYCFLPNIWVFYAQNRKSLEIFSKICTKMELVLGDFHEIASKYTPFRMV